MDNILFFILKKSYKKKFFIKIISKLEKLPYI